jgi:peptide/nickel transport system substrate-binding protein
MSQRSALRTAVLLVLAVALAVTAAACGGSKKSSGTTSTTSTGGAKSFALFRVTWDAPDYLDPGLSYTVAGWQIMWNVYEGLLGYKHAAGPEGATLIPYLAEKLPTITNGGKTYKFTLRPNLKYSSGKAVKASDFRCTIERDFQMDSPGVGFFGNIVGVGGSNGYATTKKGHIKGIVTDDASRVITINFTQPESDYSNILATQFGAFVPCGTPASDQSTKGIGKTAATGPYMITAYTPSRNFTIERNPNYNGQIPDIPAGNPDKVSGTIITDQTAAMETVLQGHSDYDFIPIPNDRLQSIQSQNADQLKIYTSANTYYYFLNTRTPPFDKLQVRQAVNFAIDRNTALPKIFGGLARPTQNILPPTYPQYQKLNPYTYNLSKAKQLVAASGDKGMKVTVWADSTPPSSDLGQYLAGQLSKIGFNASVKTLSHQVYFTTIGNQSTKAQVGFTDWYQDYPSPIDWFDVLFNGNRITQTHNNNPGNSDFPEVNNLIEKLKTEPISPSVNKQWAHVDELLVQKYAAAAPYANRTSTDFFSPKMDLSCYINHVLYQFDFSTICMK